MRSRPYFATLLLLPSVVLAVGCGSPKGPDTAPLSAKVPTAPSAAPAPSGSAAPAAKDKHELAEEAAHVDPNEKEGPIELAPLVTNPAKTVYPKATIGDHDCIKDGLEFTGKHQVDYKALIAKCGTPTGLVQYTQPHEGRLHATHDKRDHFVFKVSKGQCYRYFAMADDGIKDIDILVLKNGALIATDRTTHPMAIIDSDKPWCVDEDMTLDFAIEVDGRGAGGYTFGIWTRPKK